MTSTILVTGGTGTLGRQVVSRLRGTGATIRVLSRKGGQEGPGVEHVPVDLANGDGVDEAVKGIDVVLHLAGSNKGDEVKTRNLVEAAVQAHVQHLLYISVVGADRVSVMSGMDRAMFGYFASKLASEQIVATSGIPWTTLRATQFHDLTYKTVEGMARMPIVPVPSGFRFQPIDSGEVADRLVELALRAPAGRVPDMGGPYIYEMRDLVRSYLRAAGKHRVLMPMKMPGAAARAFREGVNLIPERAVGRRTWEEFLADRLGVSPEAGFVTA